MQTQLTKKKKGFAVMDPEQQKAIAAKGGKAIAGKGREYMSEIGRKGGEASGRVRLLKKSNEKLNVQ